MEISYYVRNFFKGMALRVIGKDTEIQGSLY